MTMTPEEIVNDMVERFRKWDARCIPLPMIMNKIFVNVKAQLAQGKPFDRGKPDRDELREKIAWKVYPEYDNWEAGLKFADRVIALYPDVEELKKNWNEIYESAKNYAVEEAKKQEKVELLKEIESWVRQYGKAYTIPRENFSKFIEALRGK